MSSNRNSKNSSSDDQAGNAEPDLPDHGKSQPAPVQNNNAILKALEAIFTGIKILFRLANYAVVLWIAGIILLAIYYAFFSGKNFSTKSLLVTEKLKIKNYEKIHLLNDDKAELIKILSGNGIEVSELADELEHITIFFLKIGKPDTQSYEDFSSLLKRSDLDQDTFKRTNCALLRNEVDAQTDQRPIVYYILYQGSSDRIMNCLNSFLGKQ